MTKETKHKLLESSIKKSLSAAVVTKESIDVELLRTENPPLAAVLDEFIMSKTTRDDPKLTAKDLMRVLEARDPSSRLAQALEKLEEQMKKTGEEE